MISANGDIDVSPTWSLQGVGYYRWFKQSHIDGNISEAGPCDRDLTILCLEGEELGGSDRASIATAQFPRTSPIRSGRWTRPRS